jgi:hypothetical protein
MDDPIQNFKDALGGDVVITGLDRRGPLSTTGILATRDWFDRRRRQLTSSGGRPTNPSWTMKRQIPLASDTWKTLMVIAAQWSEQGQRIGPGQVAGFLLEEAVTLAKDVSVTFALSHGASEENLEPRFRDWQMPQPFSGRAA